MLSPIFDVRQMTAKQLAGIKRRVLRLQLAEHAFSDSAVLARHALNAEFEERSQMYSALLGGVVVAYCRPFLEADGLGPLSDEFLEFAAKDQDRYTKLHQNLLKLRHEVYAHRDLQALSQVASEDPAKFVDPGEVVISFRPGDFTIEVKEMLMGKSGLSTSLELIDFQMAKARILTCGALGPVLGPTLPSSGRFRITERGLENA
jgi:hypothetical protein